MKDQNKNKGPLFSTTEVAIACGVSDGAIRQWILEGKMDDVRKVTGKRAFTKADLDRFVAYAQSRERKR